MGPMFILIFTYGFIDWTAWLGLSLSATEEFTAILLITSATIILKLTTNRLKVKLVSKSDVALLCMSLAVLVVESAHAYVFNTSWAVVSYCILTVALIFAFAQNARPQHYYNNLTVLFWALALIQILVLLLALIGFDAITSLATSSSAGIERKMEMYGAESFYAYRNIGPYYFSSITDNPLFDDFGILGFAREPHISFTLMAVLFGLALQNLGGFHAKALASLVFMPTLLYISTSNIAALILGGILYLSLNLYTKSPSLKLVALAACPVAMAFGPSLTGSAVEYVTANVAVDRSMAESVLNILRLLDPAMVGSGLTDIYDRNNPTPQSIGIVPLFLYLSFIAIVFREILRIMRTGLHANAMLLCYLLIYALKCATVFIFLPMIVALIIVSKADTRSARTEPIPSFRASK